MILCSNPRAQYDAHKEAIDAAVRRVFESGRYILGKEVDAFEAEFAQYQGTGNCVAVGSGTEALHVALRSLGIGPGDEVITPSHTAVATVSAIALAGATPVFADIEPAHFTLDPGRLPGLITKATKAIVAVHLYGQPADIDAIQAVTRKHGLRLVEDCAQAHGALHNGRKVGSIGDIGAFSCYPTKNLGALGDGGMLVTADPALAKQARLLRQYGWAERNISQIAGFNSRLDEVQAAILRVKLPFLDADNRARAAIAARYNEELAGTGLGLPAVRSACKHAYHLYVVRSRVRDRLLSHLEGSGVGALIHYPVPIHLQPAYKGELSVGDVLHETVRAAKEVLSLPIYPELGAREIDTVIRAVKDFKE